MDGEEKARQRCALLGLHPSPREDHAHHTEEPITELDALIGDGIAWFLGDTFLNERVAPNKQWAIIVKALRISGMKISDL